MDKHTGQGPSGQGLGGRLAPVLGRVNAAVDEEMAVRGSRWRMIAMLVGTMALIAGGLSLAKIWRVTPKGFVPLVRVSWVDMVQAMSLGRAAREHTAAGRWREAAFSWRGAVANNPADVGLLRGLLQAATMEGSRLIEEGGVPLNQAAWLLQLGRTNVADVDLVIQLLGRLEMRDSILELGSPWVGKLSVEGAVQVVRGMFDAGDFAGFDRLWKQREAEFAVDPTMSLYREAWKSHWGPPSTMREGLESLERARTNREVRTLALQLSGRVAEARADLSEHRRLLDQLVLERRAGVSDHVSHWRLLARNGRLAEARAMASESELTPTKLGEMHQLVDALLKMGLAEQAMAAVDKRPPTMRQDPRLLVLTVKCLEALERWEEVRELALSMRRDAGLVMLMEGCSYALEAIACKKLGRLEDARVAATKAGTAVVGDPAIVVAAANRLSEAGYPDSALAMFRGVEGPLKGSLSYWLQRLHVATVLGDLEEVLLATGRSYEIAPGDRRNAHNHASALILARRNPAEAVRLTFENLSVMPRNPDFQINHALALLMNDRTEEAAVVLGQLDDRTMTPLQRANFQLAWFDVCRRRSDWAGARRRYALIERERLQRVQLDRLEREFHGLPSS